MLTTRLRFIEPQLACPVEQPPGGKHWIHDIKHDGYRSQVLLERGQARVFTRNGYDWSDRYPSIVRAATNLRCQSAIIDGEAIVQNGNGVSDFEALNSAMRRQPHSIILYAFDLLHLGGRDLRQQALIERRASLKTLLGTDERSRIQFSDEFDGDGDALFKPCAEQELEGIVSKLALAPYRSGRSRTWLKTKCFTESSFVVIGAEPTNIKATRISTVSITLSLRETTSADRDQSKVAGYFVCHRSYRACRRGAISHAIGAARIRLATTTTGIQM